MAQEPTIVVNPKIPKPAGVVRRSCSALTQGRWRTKPLTAAMAARLHTTAIVIAPDRSLIRCVNVSGRNVAGFGGGTGLRAAARPRGGAGGVTGGATTRGVTTGGVGGGGATRGPAAIADCDLPTADL